MKYKGVISGWFIDPAGDYMRDMCLVKVQREQYLCPAQAVCPAGPAAMSYRPKDNQ